MKAETLAQLVQSRMDYLGLTDRTVEARTEGAVSKSTVNNIRNGRHRRVTPQTLEALAVVLEVSEDALTQLAEVVEGTPYAPPACAARLTEAQRRLVDSVIKNLVER